MAVIDVSATIRTVSNKNSKIQLVMISNMKFTEWKLETTRDTQQFIKLSTPKILSYLVRNSHTERQ